MGMTMTPNGTRDGAAGRGYTVPRRRKADYLPESVRMERLAAKVEAQADRDFRAEQAAQRVRTQNDETKVRAEFALAADARRAVALDCGRWWHRMAHPTKL